MTQALYAHMNNKFFLKKGVMPITLKTNKNTALSNNAKQSKV
jgi:hypothetical protein